MVKQRKNDKTTASKIYFGQIIKQSSVLDGEIVTAHVFYFSQTCHQLGIDRCVSVGNNDLDMVHVMELNLTELRCHSHWNWSKLFTFNLWPKFLQLCSIHSSKILALVDDDAFAYEQVIYCLHVGQKMTTEL